ncbi:RNA polymerase sigma factor [Streptomyces sp. 796.1]|uniref:RNA polymerase sigma factor n=1 Tax=Streptomyces sp. 796.1 TaxID=3163029 RepID=UPI0039C9E8EA
MATDEELLTRSVTDASAFEPLVERHSRALHGYFARRAPEAADDLLAEAWLRAYAGRHTYQASRGPARAWLFGVARNVLAAHWRGRERALGSVAVLAGEPSSDPWHAVDQRLDAAAVAPLMRQTLAELPAVERELLLLVAWEQLSPTEAATVVGIPAGTARSRLYRARTRLRTALGPAAPLSLTGDLS